jgi:cobalt/nickel transport protein
MRRPVVDLALLALTVAVFAVPLGLRLGVSDSGAEAYTGSDSAAAEAVLDLDPGYRPWFSPWFEPGSAEIESGLFALQAAGGAGGLGFALGRLAGRGRRVGAQ